MTIFWLGLALAVIGTLADYWTTREALRFPGVRETNVVSAWLMRKTGTVWVPALLVDAIAIGGMGYVIFQYLGAQTCGMFLALAGAIQLVAADGNYRIWKERDR